VRREHLVESAKRIRLKENMSCCTRCWKAASRVPLRFLRALRSSGGSIHSRSEACADESHPGHGVQVTASGEIDSITAGAAGYGKVAALNQIAGQSAGWAGTRGLLGDGSSDLHVMLQVNGNDGYTIAVSDSKNVTQIAKRTVLSTNALRFWRPSLKK